MTTLIFVLLYLVVSVAG